MYAAKSRRAAIFARTSTDEQHLDCQTPELLRLCRARGFDVVAVFEEVGSAAARERREYERMKLAAHRGEFDVLCIAAIDRLGRSMTGNLQAILEFDRIGVEIVSLREPWLAMGGPVRALLVAVFSWVAEQERLQIVARTRLAWSALGGPASRSGGRR